MKIELTLDNAAFDGDEGYEAGRILRQFGAELSHLAPCGEAFEHYFPQNLRDLNGNVVGRVTLEA